jgi:hypothetical protein
MVCKATNLTRNPILILTLIIRNWRSIVTFRWFYCIRASFLAPLLIRGILMLSAPFPCLISSLLLSSRWILNLLLGQALVSLLPCEVSCQSVAPSSTLAIDTKSYSCWSCPDASLHDSTSPGPWELTRLSRWSSVKPHRRATLDMANKFGRSRFRRVGTRVKDWGQNESGWWDSGERWGRGLMVIRLRVTSYLPLTPICISIVCPTNRPSS